MENGSSDLLHKNFLVEINNHVHGTLHKCPYKDSLVMLNFTVPWTEYIRAWPKGDYKTSFKIYDDIDDAGISAKIFFSIKVRTGDTF
jgi:hypothetical protein